MWTPIDAVAVEVHAKGIFSASAVHPLGRLSAARELGPRLVPSTRALRRPTLVFARRESLAHAQSHTNLFFFTHESHGSGSNMARSRARDRGHSAREG